ASSPTRPTCTWSSRSSGWCISASYGPGWSVDRSTVVGTPALTSFSTSNPCACSSSSWSAVTTSRNFSPGAILTRDGDGVTCLPFTVISRVLTLGLALAVGEDAGLDDVWPADELGA